MNKDTKIIWKNIDELKPYEHNAKEHNETQVKNLATSIEKYGWQNPVLIDKDNVIIAGHGRVLGAKELGLTEAPCIYADDLTEEQVREYRILDNKLTESAWLDDELSFELEELDFSDFDLDFDIDEITFEEEREKYTTSVMLPQYEIKGIDCKIDELINTDKVSELISEIEQSNINEAEKEFLKICAYRHAVIDFEKVAEYYAKADKEMQGLMENNALVFIDIENAIANGFARLSTVLEEQMEQEIEE